MKTTTAIPFRMARPPLRALRALLALLLLAGTLSQGQAQENTSISSSSIIIDRGGPTGNETFGCKNGLPAPAFQGRNLGSFDISSFATRLVLNGGTLTTQESAPDEVNSGSLTYRVRANGSAAILRSGTIALPQMSASDGMRMFAATTANTSLLTGLTAGSYILSVQLVAEGVRSGPDGGAFAIPDPPFRFLEATFTVTGIAPSEPANSTTWTGGKNDNWFDAANWTQGVPTATKDANVPNFGSGSTVAYPNIYSNAAKPATITTTRIQNLDGTFTDVQTTTPGYDNSGSGPALTHDLTMQGTNQLQRSLVRLLVGRLQVYGGFNNQQDSFIQRDNTVISFAGGDQTISGSASGFAGVEIDGGGLKTLTTSFTILPGSTLQFISGVLETNVSNVNVEFVELAPATVSNGVTTPSGQLAGETDLSHLRGFLKTTQLAQAGIAQNFGNSGLSLTFSGNGPGNVSITRNTSLNYGSINNGTNGNPSIRRVYGVRPSNPHLTDGGLRATLVFHYLDDETRNLMPDNQRLTEADFALFLSTSSGDIFGQLGRDGLNTTTNQLTKNNVTSFGTFTLSEATEPLPVTLTAFSAKREDTNAVLTWQTATEFNSRGFEVQVSTDGRQFRVLAFVPSQSATSTSLSTYRYVDTETGKQGIRYYRLRQVDLDGKAAFYGSKAVSFASRTAFAARLDVFPNPFTDTIHMTAASVETDQGEVTLLDLTGRIVRQQTSTLGAGSNKLTLIGLSELPAGIYVVRFAPLGGVVQTTRILKQ
ncbi:T9SS type A sorting domain-containing protein [Hymenobacter sp. J193]|uniref:T9SS type A sorting domain-containing protein n=1 Tax=Hymenobacter sp. J193 TaxID=2898429 RepID=UPI0021506FC8|nr:T9SS type A sorting domain-containing protein [Hymenobacter sp. J193]MCR5889511.1 T9SS type A sorting domain-containing protein [Hymenobacter sp. J193]